MERVQLIHWNAGEAAERAERLRAFGYAVTFAWAGGPTFLREMGNDPPAAIVIDLGRLPSQGRDMALLIRMRATTRYVPLVFVGGDPEKVARIQELLPDAVYTSWEQIGNSLPEAIANPLSDPVTPRSGFEAYAGRPLPAKLGIKAHSVVGLVCAPADFEQALGELPEGVQLHRQVHEGCDLTIWFARSLDELQREMEQMAALSGSGSLWVAWPKRVSGEATNLTQQQVREAGLAVGLVDYKICSIDETWSGLLFTQRKSKQPPPGPG